MMVHLSPLVCRPRPYPDESLLSYLLRVQVANGYEGLVWLTEWLRDKTKSRIKLFPTSTNQLVFLENLATVTTIPVNVLYQLTLNRYLTRLTPPGGMVTTQSSESGEQFAFCFQRHTLRRWSRTEAAAAFCPHCLREAPYHRLPWMLHAVFACLKHKCWLLDTCADCGIDLSVTAVIKGQCTTCSAVLADMPTVDLDTTVLVVQQHLLTCLETDVLPVDTLPQLSIPAFFRLLEGLGLVIRRLGWDWPGCYQSAGIVREAFPSYKQHDLSITQFGILYTSAWLAIQDWPQGFYTFVDRYRGQLGAENGDPSIQRNFGTLYSSWLEIRWRHPDFEPVQRAFNEYLLNHFPPSRQITSLARIKRYPELSERMKLVGVGHAANLLGVTGQTIERMVRDGYVRAYYSQGQPDGRNYFVYQEDLEPGWRQRMAVVTIGQVAREFCSKHGIVNDWIAEGLIAQTGSCLVRGVSRPSFTRQDVDDFLDRLAQHVCIAPERPDNAKTLKQVCISNTQIGMTVTRVFQRMLAGKLKVYHSDSRLQPFDQLWFDVTDVDSLLKQVKAENNWMTLREIPSFLHVELKLVRHWVKTGLLIPVTTMSRSVYFDRAAVDAFRQRILRSSDVIKLLETNRSSLWLWAGAGYLPLLFNSSEHQRNSYLFDRNAIDQWHAQYVTPTEAQRILGASLYIAFRKRVSAGDYPSPVPQDMTPKFYYRTDFERFWSGLEQQL
ncbi:MAG: hypothetical protein HN929_00890 [Chloroflexi bacterium]|jgi:hypothetical protein|nr:hypothetical protein [Chloroflexota bacterium]